MDLLQDVIKPKESWNAILLEMGMSNVIAHLKEKKYSLIEFRLLAPYFVPSKAVSQTLTSEYKTFLEKVSDKSEELTTLVYRSLVPRVSDPSLFRRFSTSSTKIYTDTYDVSVSKWLTELVDEIEYHENLPKPEYIIYLIDSTYLRNIPYEEILPFKNYISF
jgi:hypothetical protein